MFDINNLQVKSNINAMQLEEAINKIKQDNKLKGLGTAFIDAENKYNVNAIILASIACLESRYGTSKLAIEKNNLFGLDAPLSATGTNNYGSGYKNKEECIDYAGHRIGKQYLELDSKASWRYCEGKKDIYAVGAKWCEVKGWSDKVISIANRIKNNINGGNSMNLLILDAGHAKSTPGKNNASQNFYEWEFNNDMQYKIKARCEELGIKVFLTNPNPSTVSDIALSTRASLANDYWLRNSKPKSMFISLHANAFSSSSARGTETYHANNASTTSKNFAKALNDEVVKVMKKLDPNSKDRGVKCKDWTVIQKASMPSVLVEYAFYTNLDDLKILKNNKNELVEVTVKAICQYFGIEYKENTSSTDNKLYAVCVTACKYDSAKKMQQELIDKGYKDTYLIPR